MNRFILLAFFSMLLSIGLIGCQQGNGGKNQIVKEESNKVNKEKNIVTSKKDVKEEIWNQLTSDDKKHIEGSWENANVRKITLRKEMGSIYNSKFIGKDVYIIDYPSNDNPTLGGIVVYADIKSHQLIGRGYRE